MRVLFFYHGYEHIGIESLSAYLKERGHEVGLVFDPGIGTNFLVDFPVFDLLIPRRRLTEAAVRFAPDLVAIGAVTNSYGITKDFTQRVKEVLDVPTIIGGVHATAAPEVVIREDCFDMVCVGEGEEALGELIERMEDKRKYEDVRNLWVKGADGQVHTNELRPLIEDLDALPFQDRELFIRFGMLSDSVMVMTGRDCPYACTFCVNSTRKKLYGKARSLRRRSVDSVIAELKDYRARHPVRRVDFLDDLFTYDLGWLCEFRLRYTDEIGLPYTCHATSATASDEVLAELSASGCRSVYMGAQSGNERVRREILNRHDSNRQIVDAVRRIRRHGLRVTLDFIFGVPDETPREMRDSFDLAREAEPDFVEAFSFYPFPGTELAELSLRRGIFRGEKYKNLLLRGDGSFYCNEHLDHPHRSEASKYVAILSTYISAPRFLKRPLERMLDWPYGPLHKLLRVVSAALTNPQRFVERILLLPRLVLATRRALRTASGGKDA